MRALTADEHDCLTRLEEWHAKIGQIFGLYDQHDHLSRQGAAEARERYTALKRALEAEHRDCDNSQRRPPLTKAERMWYARTIHQAFVRLLARTHAPNDWSSLLFEAQSEIFLTISAMKVVEKS